MNNNYSNNFNNSVNTNNIGNVEFTNTNTNPIPNLNQNPNINSNQNNNEEVVFSNFGNSNENDSNMKNFIFNKKNIVIEEEIYVKNDDRIYTDDLIYLRDLQNQLLSSFPIHKQSLMYVQENAEKDAQEIINIKNLFL